MAETITLARGMKIDPSKIRLDYVPDWRRQQEIKETEMAVIDFLLARGYIEPVIFDKPKEQKKKEKKKVKGINSIKVIKALTKEELFFNNKNRRALEMALIKLKEELRAIQVEETKPEPVPEPVPQEQEDERGQILSMIKAAGGPSEAEIEKLKKEHGGVYTLILSQNEIYLFTHLNVEDYREVTSTLSKVTDPSKQLNVNELVVMSCVLWPKITDKTILKEKAGTIESLNKAIMLNSYFLNEQTIRQFTFVL